LKGQLGLIFQMEQLKSNCLNAQKQIGPKTIIREECVLEFFLYKVNNHNKINLSFEKKVEKYHRQLTSNYKIDHTTVL
jgi:hypothetical protein